MALQNTQKHKCYESVKLGNGLITSSARALLHHGEVCTDSSPSHSLCTPSDPLAT